MTTHYHSMNPLGRAIFSIEIACKSTAYVVNPLVIVITLIITSGRFVDWSIL